MVIECAVGEWRSIYVHAFVLEADILSKYCNKDDVRWHVWLILRDNTCQSRYCLLPFSLSFKYTLNYCVDGSIWHFKFPKVVQAHTLGEVGNLGTVSLTVSSGTILPIFIKIGSYLTDKEQKISWHSFFWDTVYIPSVYWHSWLGDQGTSTVKKVLILQFTKVYFRDWPNQG